MPLPARDLWAKIQKETQGKSDRDQLRILHRYLDEWHDSWKGPYWDLKERLRKLVHKLENTESVKSRGQQDSFHVKRQGNAQVGLIGPPNCGKSALVYALSGAPTAIADYPFATQHPVPGMLVCPGGALQIVDTPPIVPGLWQGEGSGRMLLSLISIMDAVALVVDLSEDPLPQMEVTLAELSAMQIETVPAPLETVLHVKGKEGIKFQGCEISKAEQTIARKLLTTAQIDHAEIAVPYRFSETQLRAQVDRRKLMPSLILANKDDSTGAPDRIAQLAEAYPEYRLLAVNFTSEDRLDALVDSLLWLLGFICVQVLDRPDPEAAAAPHLVPRSSSVADVTACTSSAKDGLIKGARIWGDSAGQPGQTVGLHHLVADGDLIHLHE